MGAGARRGWARMVEYGELEQALQQLGMEQGAAEFHGTLCGQLCAGAERGPRDSLMPSAGGSEPENEQALVEQMRDEALNGLTDADLGFTPLLPDDQQRLGLRVDALAQWCAGFVYGFASAREDVSLDALSSEAQELVRDLTQISRAGLSPDADRETDEQAYAEIVEYVRVGAQLLFMEIAAARRSASNGETLH